MIFIEAMICKNYGEEYSNCIYLLYDGIHYDALARTFAEEADFDFDET